MRVKGVASSASASLVLRDLTPVGGFGGLTDHRNRQRVHVLGTAAPPTGARFGNSGTANGCTFWEQRHRQRVHVLGTAAPPTGARFGNSGYRYPATAGTTRNDCAR